MKLRDLRFSGKRQPAAPGAPIGMAGANRLRCGGRDAALGLLWQPSQPQIPLREQARLAGGPHDGFDLCARFAAGRQIGFASTGDGLSAGMPAGASMCGSPSWGDNWLAAFEISGEPASWWIIALRGGLIYEDQLHGNSDSACAAFRKSLEAPDWEHIVAPNSWNIEGAVEAPLAEAMATAPGAKLRPVNRWPRIAFAAASALIALFCLYFGWSAVSEFRASKQREQAAAKPDPAVLQSFPWSETPDIRSFVNLCADEMDRLAVAVPGWTIQDAECVWSGAGALVKVRRKRQGGSAAWLQAALNIRSAGEAVILKGGQLAEQHSAVRFAASAGAAAIGPEDPARLESRLRDRFLTLGLELKLVSRNAKPRAGSGKSSRRSFGYHEINVATSAAVREYAQLIADVPALVPQRLVYRPDAARWLLTARAYHPVAGIGASGMNRRSSE